VTCGNITGVVDRLEQAGYLRRERQRDDRRVVLAKLTPAGEALYRRALPEVLETLSELTGDLSLEELDALGRCCEKLHLSVEARKQSDLMGRESAQLGAADTNG
jgi:DNA-binding MarR family transcriptional regulator